MIFNSTTFLFVFLPTLLALYFLPIKNCFKITWQNVVLLVFSLGFYAWTEPVFIFIMFGLILFNYFLALAISKSNNKKDLLVITITFDIAFLSIFKYLPIISNTISNLSDKVSIIEIALPAGISFFVFQIMSYVFDVYYGRCYVQKNPFKLLLFMFFFPQSIAGPIVRYKDIEDQIESRDVSSDDFYCGVKRFIYGLAKKMLIANYLAQIADNIFDYLTMSSMSVATAWIGIISYTLQIYYDFSSYSDMAIGLGRMFGFSFLENFNYPYIASSITDFWRRWHISLSSWFKDYVYIPLGGNRCGKFKRILNLLIVWLLTGIWHGMSWTFISWGLLNFVFLIIEKQLHFEKKDTIFSHIYTLLAIMFTWVLFRSNNISSAIKYIGYLFGYGTTQIIDEISKTILSGTYIVIILGIIGSTPLISNLFNRLNKNTKLIEQIFLIIIFILSIIQIISSTYNPFIYFNF